MEPSAAIPIQIKAARERLGWTQQRLADELAAYDPEVRLNRAAIAKMESRSRNVSVDELVAIAATMDVSPLLLMFPIGLGRTATLTPGNETSIDNLVDWCMSHSTVRDSEGHRRANQPLQLLDFLRYAIRGAEVNHPGDDTITDAYREALEYLHRTLLEFDAAGVVAPALHRGLVVDMERAGLDLQGIVSLGEVD